MKKIIVLALFLCGCATTPNIYLLTIADYQEVYDLVKLGMTHHEVQAILVPTQFRLGQTDIKLPDRFTHKGKNYKVLYFRSGWQNDGLTTDDEFTPYLFEDSKLISIGWLRLGGPGSQGIPKPQINVEYPDYYPYRRHPYYW